MSLQLWTVQPPPANGSGSGSNGVSPLTSHLNDCQVQKTGNGQEGSKTRGGMEGRKQGPRNGGKTGKDGLKEARAELLAYQKAEMGKKAGDDL
eukprot:357656-Chlamydomonas_euryale.AAC.2